MLSRFLINLILGGLLTISLLNLYRYLWFIPSPFNMDWLKDLYRHKEYTDEYSFKSYLACYIFVLLSFSIQISISSIYVSIKRILTSQLSILDSIIICTIPALYSLSLVLLGWAEFSSEQNLETFTSDSATKEKFKGQLKFFS